MRILVAGVNYAPEVTGIAPFTTGLAEHLAQGGHDVTVATTFPFAPHWEWFQPPPAWRTRERLNAVDVWRTKIVLPKKRTTLGRIVFDTSVGFASAMTAVSIPAVDVAICVSPPIQTALAAAAVRFKVRKLVILVQDLPTQAAHSVGMLKEGHALRAGRSVEHLAYRLADHLVAISSSFTAYIEGAGVEGSKISEIPNWADTASIQPTNPDPSTRARLGAAAEDFLVVHAGNMGAKQDLLNVIAAAALLEKDRQIKLALVGDGQEREAVAENIATRRLQNVRLLPIQESSDLSRILASADALLINQAPMLVDSVLPSKLLAYMAAGRPVLAAVHPKSGTADIVRRAGCGLLIDPGRPEALANEIRAVAVDHDRRAALKVMGECGQPYVAEHFDRGAVLSRWDELLASLG